MSKVQKLTTADTFTKEGVFVPRGQLITVDTDDLSGNETNLIDYKGDTTLATVEISAVAPTGPNPINPQQVPVDAVQTVAGHVIPGARLVGEVTAPAETRIDNAGIGSGSTAQSDIADALFDDASGQADDDKPKGKKAKAETKADADAA